MNDAHSPMSYMGGEGPSSPKRKKMRQKYAPKACVSCRRSKLKCTGEVPCQRCVDSGKRCFYSEDQTAAEVLQNLSRPTPTPTNQSSMFSNSNGNGHAAPRPGAMPQNSLSHRRPSDNGSPGMTMEQRMARMEAMMEALVQDRGLHFTPSGSLEREQSVGHRSESAFSMPILDPIHPALDQMVQQSPEQQQQLALGTDPAQRPDATVLVRIGNQDQTLPFPEDFTHVMYVSNFFGDIHLRHPCIDETDFFARTGRILTNGALETTDVHFLALSYVIFACSQAVNHRPHLHGTGPDESPGWRWYLLADSIVDKKALLSGCNDLTLIQYLLFQSLYFAYADMPALAYGAIRTTCTAVLQQNLHQQSTWNHMEVEKAYQQLCVLWNVVISDRAISRSCGRPSSLNLEDIHMEMPGDFYTRNQLNVRVYPDPLEDSKQQNAHALIRYQIQSAQLARSLCSELKHTNNNESETIRSILFKECAPVIELEPDTLVSKTPQSTTLEHSMIMGRIAIGLVVGRNFISSRDPGSSMISRMSVLACDTVRHVKDNPAHGPEFSCFYQTTSVIAGALLALAMLVLQDCLDPLYSMHVDYFMDASEFLSEYARFNLYARRVRDDFSAITSVVAGISEKMNTPVFSRRGAREFDYNDAKDLIPSNILDSLPYSALSPNLSHRSGVVWLF